MTQTKDRLASLSALRWHLLLVLGAALAVVLLGITLTVRPALATPSPISPQTQTAEPEEDWGDPEDWEETCEEEECKEEAWEEVPGEDEGGWAQVYDEEAKEEALGGGPTTGPSSECPLGTVKPKKAIFERARGKLRLVLRYTTDSPTQVGIDFWLRGSRRAMNDPGSARRQLNRTGVLRLGRHVDTQAKDEIRAARVVIVQLKAPQAPPSCPSQLTKRLAVGHTGVASAERPARGRG